jgi:DNA-binding transcriptional regulator GbsR (MarR family)
MGYFRTIADQRHKREIAPKLHMLHQALQIEVTNPQDIFAEKRIGDMHELLELMTNWFSDVRQLEEHTLCQLMKLGTAAQKILLFKEKLGFRVVPEKQA